MRCAVSGTKHKSQLWNDNETENFSNEGYHHLLMEQYKICVEMTDRLNARRSLMNIFFLTLHAIILSMVALSLSHNPVIHKLGLMVVPLVVLLLLCYTWGKIATFYRGVNRERSRVINELEARLPSNPYAVSEKHNAYGVLQNPLQQMETVLPWAFGILYALSFVYITYFAHH
ncbi:MAG: hypothetical protein COB50_00010 [Thiotrichales bacterium]|nr:MAG: hypothetical protein COB50_00010 [Thiotrichales bacterium]